MGDFTGSVTLSHLPAETRAAAVRYLEGSGNDDVAQILGLAEPTCSACGKPLPKRGGCRPCQKAAGGAR